MTGRHTPGPWQRGRPCDTVVAATSAANFVSTDHVRHYGGHLIAESIAPQNIPLISSAPMLARRLERSDENMRAAADGLEAAARICRINSMLDTARTIETAISHLRSSSRLNACVIERARGNSTTTETDNP